MTNTFTLEKVYLYIIKFGVYSLFLVPLLITRNYFFPYIFGKAIVLRIIIEVIAVLFILLVLLNRKYMPKRTYLFGGVVAYMAIKGLTTLTGVNPYHSFWSNYERMEGFLTLIHFGILLVILSGVFRKMEEWKWVFRAAVFGGFWVALIGLGQKLNLGFILNAGIAKIDSTIGNSSYVAAYLIYSVFLLIYLFFADKHWYWRVPYGLIFILDVLIIFFTMSRGGMVGLIGGTVLLLLLYIFATSGEVVRMRYRCLAIGFIIFILFLGGFSYLSREQSWVKENRILNKLTSLSLQDPTIKDRIINAKIGLRGFKERFFLGFGMENYYVPFNKYYDSRTSEAWFDRAHNIIFDQAISGGVFGLLAYLFLFLLSFYYLWQRRRQGYSVSFVFISLLAASFFVNLFVFDNSSTYTLFFTVLGFVNFWAVAQEKEPEERRQGQTNVFIPIFLAIILGLALYFFNIKPAIANRTSIEAYKYSKADFDKAELLFKKALDYKTFGNPEIALRIGDVASAVIDEDDDKELAVRAMGFAEKSLKEAIRMEPLNARYYLYLGRLYALYFSKTEKSEENFRKAVEYLEKAQELSPKRQEIYYILGQVMMSVGRNKDAVVYFQKAMDIKLDLISLYNLLLAYLYAGEDYKEEADEIYEQIYENGFFPDYEENRIDELVGIYYGRDDFLKIIRILDFIIERRSGNSGWQEKLALYEGKLAALYKELGKKEEAREHALKAAELDPEIKEMTEDFIQGL